MSLILSLFAGQGLLREKSAIFLSLYLSIYLSIASTSYPVITENLPCIPLKNTPSFLLWNITFFHVFSHLSISLQVYHTSSSSLLPHHSCLLTKSVSHSLFVPCDPNQCRMFLLTRSSHFCFHVTLPFQAFIFFPAVTLNYSTCTFLSLSLCNIITQQISDSFDIFVRGRAHQTQLTSREKH